MHRPGELGSLLQDASSPRVADQLIAVANARGGADNITTVVIAIEDAPRAFDTTTPGIHRLRGMQVFERLTDSELSRLARHLERRMVKPGTLLFREGDPGDDLFLLGQGEVVLTRSGQHLATIESGASFGEIELLDYGSRCASALVTRPSELLILRRHRFDQLIRQDAHLAATLVATLVRMKPSTAKGVYVRSVAISSTMGPGVRVDTQDAQRAAEGR